MDKTRAAATHSLKALTLASSTFATIYSVFNCSHFNFLTVWSLLWILITSTIGPPLMDTLLHHGPTHLNIRYKLHMCPRLQKALNLSKILDKRKTAHNAIDKLQKGRLISCKNGIYFRESTGQSTLGGVPSLCLRRLYTPKPCNISLKSTIIKDWVNGR
jgi:hypothetical protein